MYADRVMKCVKKALYCQSHQEQKPGERRDRGQDSPSEASTRVSFRDGPEKTSWAQVIAPSANTKKTIVDRPFGIPPDENR